MNPKTYYIDSEKAADLHKLLATIRSPRVGYNPDPRKMANQVIANNAEAVEQILNLLERCESQTPAFQATQE